MTAMKICLKVTDLFNLTVYLTSHPMNQQGLLISCVLEQDLLVSQGVGETLGPTEDLHHPPKRPKYHEK
jgi:hypothetical protein